MTMQPRHVSIGDLTLGNDLPLVFIVGPNTLESRGHALEISAALAEMAQKLKIGLIYKTSFDKANRSSIGGERGIGLKTGLPILAEVRETTGLPVLTDIHAPEQCAPVAEVVDLLQTPAFLCRQTDLLLAAGATGKQRILLCERGAMFGYNNLVVDMRALPIMAQTGYPVVFDATHAVAQPGGLGDRSGGEREFGPVLARAAVAIGIAAVFIETHQDPDRAATAEASTMLPLKALPELLETLLALDRIAKTRLADVM